MGKTADVALLRTTTCATFAGEALNVMRRPISSDLIELIVQATTETVRLLVAGRYSELVQLSGGSRLTQAELRLAVRDYGRTLAMPPAAHFRALDVVPVAGPNPPRWTISCDLWTLEEGRSDLTLELTIIDRGVSKLGVEIDDLHVL